MRQHKITYGIQYICRLAACFAAITVMLLPLKVSAAAYSERSMLAEGNWLKVNATTRGLQTLSRQTLRNFGFNDPEKVYVYGYGGRMISETLSADHPDDLPPVPVFRGSDGSISFFATDNITLQRSSSVNAMEFDHVISPYSDDSYYFISDRAPAEEISGLDLSDTSGMATAHTATHHLVHEKDLLQCATSGRDYLGEDFRSVKSQTFNFDLPDNAADKVTIRVRFGANATAASSFMISANGERLPATNSDKIDRVTSSSQYYCTATSTKTATVTGNSLAVGIEYSQAGVVSTARLDWIEVEYTRQLAMRNSQLLFHVNPSSPTAYCISGVGSDAIVWDVTKPWDIKPVTGKYDQQQQTLTIGIRTPGFREFLVFEPSAKGTAIQGRIKVANQDIHGMATPHMVIITPEQYLSIAQRIADIHRRADGMEVCILTPEIIFNEFSSGNPDVSAFRKLHKMWYDRSQADPSGVRFGYSLLLGRPTYDQKRKNPEVVKCGYPTTLIWQSGDAYSETTSYCTDDFIAMLEEETSEGKMWKRIQNIAIGRYPITSLMEGNVIADKLEAYIFSPEYGTWRTNVMTIADDGDNSDHFNQAQKCVERMKATEAGSHLAYEKLYLDAFELKQTGSGLIFPDAKERMLRKWEKEGVSLINYIGHANPKEWGHEKLLTWNDITDMANQRLPILYAATCSFGKWDAESVSGGEYLLSNPVGGAIAVITPSRTVYISPNEYITNAVANHYFMRDADGLGMRLGDVLRLGKNTARDITDANMNRYHLFGDPALRMPTARYKVTVDSLAGRPVVADVADAPSVKARSSFKVTGRVTDLDGNTIDFNGPVQYTLFDAEKSVTTHGWGEKGKQEVYQDQSDKLATGRATASGGKWSATILMPTEISNNYTPAFLTLYAFDTMLKAEAAGSTDKLYVYGYDENALEDFDGPVIESFGINTTEQATGVMTDPHPTVLAVFSDDSGINISDAGIGHQMTLTLDSQKEYDDLSNFYTPDPEIPGKGSIAYPLVNLEPGEHTLKLIVWDNANNSTSAELAFNVGINLPPDLTDLSLLYHRESDQLSIKASVDRAMTKMGYTIECFDLSGREVWKVRNTSNTGNQSAVQHTWDLRDTNGDRVPRGIYIIKATVETEEGVCASERKKIAIPAK